MTPSQDATTTLPALIRQSRMHLDLSYEQLAKKMDAAPIGRHWPESAKHHTTPRILRQVEEGTHTPSGVLIAKYAHALGLAEDHLLSLRRFPGGDKPLAPDHPGRTLCEVCDQPIPDHAACFTDLSTGFSYHPTCRPIPKTAPRYTLEELALNDKPQEESCAACHQPPTVENPLITTTTGTREHVLECPGTNTQEPTNPIQEAYEALTVHNNPARAAVLLHQYLNQP